MNIPKRLSVVFLLIFSLFAVIPADSNTPACPSFQFSVELEKPSNESFTLTINAAGGKLPYYYLVLNDKNTLVSTDFSRNVFNDLKPGRYRCIVADKDDCTLEKFVDVK